MAPNQITGPSAGGQDVYVLLNRPAELDYKTKDEILSLRTSLVKQYPQLSSGAYTPLADVFGQIVSGKPWWGLIGHYTYSGTEQSIEGASEESRFLMNPFVLVGLAELNGWIHPYPPSNTVEYFPQPTALTYHSSRDATVKYSVSEHFSYLVRNRYWNGEGRTLNLIAYNARDFGFNFLYVDEEASRNITSANQTGSAIGIAQYIHLGGSCGHPDGCNNMSPMQEDLNVEIGAMPARIAVKLWKEAPAAVSLPADMLFIIEMD